MSIIYLIYFVSLVTVLIIGRYDLKNLLEKGEDVDEYSFYIMIALALIPFVNTLSLVYILFSSINYKKVLYKIFFLDNYYKEEKKEI